MRTVPPSRRLPAGWGVGVGAGLGLLFGVLLDQLALGVVFGAAVGLVLGSIASTVQDVPEARRRSVLGGAVAILVAGLVAVILIRGG